MSFKWTTNEIATTTITIYETNLTLNKAACKYFEEVTHVLLGFDDETDQLAIKPVTREEMMNEVYPISQLHRISLGKSYGRITNKSFIENIANRFNLKFGDNQCYKYQAKFDVILQMMIIQL